MSVLDKFIKHLDNNLPHTDSFHPHFDESLKIMLKAGGKHFRAQLLLGMVKAYKPELLDNAMDIALGLEMIHTYSLIHDDLPAMDNAAFRRGVPTLHTTYDETTAILAGDALNTHAFFVLSNANLDDKTKILCIQSLSKNAGIYGMVLGQAIDCFFENKHLDIDELKFLHKHKTGALIASSLEMGAIISGQSNTKEIYDIGLKLGLAFQIQDDIIDATSSSNEAGKPTNNDTNKNSFTNLLGLNGAIEAKNSLIDEIYTQISKFDDKFQNMIKNLINKYIKG
ncbi:polyprenyl synthetase family protein [Campylobacter sputorum]|uniref:polyprenyl synthetase family protein n=1 Tax=Campylobacter sputorum TaxID=206 RepID=UPI001E360D28|nr:polyprenyl synthetase family protein [Campylobacter sputorum]